MDEQQQQSEALEGAEKNEPVAGGGPASELAQAREREQKAVAQRREVGAKLDDALGRNKELELEGQKLARLLELSEASKKSPKDATEPPEWALKLTADVVDLRESLAGEKAKQARGAAHAEIMKTVPDGNKAAAKLMLDGMEANGLDFTKAGAVDTAQKQLQQTTVMFDQSRESPRRSPQVDPNVPPDFSHYRTWEEVPPDWRGRVPDDVAAKLSGRGPTGGGNDGMLI